MHVNDAEGDIARRVRMVVLLVLQGILGFLPVYVLNESRRIGSHMDPGFVALFAFTFAVTVGTLWAPHSSVALAGGT